VWVSASGIDNRNGKGADSVRALLEKSNVVVVMLLLFVMVGRKLNSRSYCCCCLLFKRGPVETDSRGVVVAVPPSLRAYALLFVVCC